MLIPNSWGWITKSDIKNHCYACQSPKIYQQIAGFWFCYYHLEEAIEIGASTWIRLNERIYG
jgi:hypothetical protein